MTAAPATMPGGAPPPAWPEAELPWLVGDIGGTNARFGWVQAVGGSALHVRTLPVADHDGPASAVRAYLAGLQAEGAGAMPGGAMPVPRRAALAVATALGGDRVAFTNSHWRFSIAALQAELGLRSLSVLNDFEALALALPRLQPAQLRWQGLAPQPQGHHGTLAVIGPGTGLGVGGVVHTRAGWQALPGEGGHATLSAADEFEARLLDQVRRTHEHVSAERLLSGIGLPMLHQALAAVRGVAAPARATAEIVERGLAPPGGADADALCSDTLDSFCALLGSFAGNVALTLGARGGVYIGGGIVPRLGDRFFASRFRERFEAKGRFRGYLEAIPTPLITDTLVALSGATAAIEQAAG